LAISYRLTAARSVLGYASQLIHLTFQLPEMIRDDLDTISDTNQLPLNKNLDLEAAQRALDTIDDALNGKRPVCATTQ
jgi:hypothetical protein